MKKGVRWTGADVNRHLARHPGAATVPANASPPATVQEFFKARLNKLESEFYALLKYRHRAGEITWLGEPQSIRLTLAPNTTYTADFAAILADGQFVFYETKGFRRDDAMVKIKTAAVLFPWAKFILVEKHVSGCYRETVMPSVLPQ